MLDLLTHIEFFGPTNRVGDGPQSLFAVRGPDGLLTGPLFYTRCEAADHRDQVWPAIQGRERDED